MKKVVDIQARDFDYEIKSNNPVVVEFWIKSCGNCKKFKPVYEKLSEVFDNRLSSFELTCSKVLRISD